MNSPEGKPDSSISKERGSAKFQKAVKSLALVASLFLSSPATAQETTSANETKNENLDNMRTVKKSFEDFQTDEGSERKYTFQVDGPFNRPFFDRALLDRLELGNVLYYPYKSMVYGIEKNVKFATENFRFGESKDKGFFVGANITLDDEMEFVIDYVGYDMDHDGKVDEADIKILRVLDKNNPKWLRDKINIGFGRYMNGVNHISRKELNSIIDENDRKKALKQFDLMYHNVLGQIAKYQESDGQSKTPQKKLVPTESQFEKHEQKNSHSEKPSLLFSIEYGKDNFKEVTDYVYSLENRNTDFSGNTVMHNAGQLAITVKNGLFDLILRRIVGNISSSGSIIIKLEHGRQQTEIDSEGNIKTVPTSKNGRWVILAFGVDEEEQDALPKKN